MKASGQGLPNGLWPWWLPTGLFGVGGGTELILEHKVKLRSEAPVKPAVWSRISQCPSVQPHGVCGLCGCPHGAGGAG